MSAAAQIIPNSMADCQPTRATWVNRNHRDLKLPLPCSLHDPAHAVAAVSTADSTLQNLRA
jgi:hypothetical protein